MRLLTFVWFPFLQIQGLGDTARHLPYLFLVIPGGAGRHGVGPGPAVPESDAHADPGVVPAVDGGALDDEFHRRVCALSGHEFAWSLIREKKAHMDRVRFLSLSFGAQQALDDHRAILAAMKAGDAEAAEAEIRTHLGRIEDILARVRVTHAAHFGSEG